MDGRTGIINQALLYANQDSIINPGGDNKNAKLCAQVYDTSLQEALSGYPWSFALVAAKLQRLDKKPKDFRFSIAYQLPGNFGHMQVATAGVEIKETVLDFLGTNLPMQNVSSLANTIPVPEYVVHGGELYSNINNIQIVYSRTDVLPSDMPPQFKNYFAAYLASKVYYKITGGLEGLEFLQKKIRELKAEARHTDGDQTDTMPTNLPNLFLGVRSY